MMIRWSGLHTEIAQLGGYHLKVIRNQVNIVKNLDGGNPGSNGNVFQKGLSETDKGTAASCDLFIDFASDILQ